MKKILSLLILVFSVNSFALDLSCRISNIRIGFESDFIERFTLTPASGEVSDIKVYLSNVDVTEVTDLVELYEVERETVEIKKGQFIFFVYGAGESKNIYSISIGKANTTFTPTSLSEILTSGQTTHETRVDYDYGAVGTDRVALVNNKEKILFACKINDPSSEEL